MVEVKKKGFVSSVIITDGTKEKQAAQMKRVSACNAIRQYGGEIIQTRDLEEGYQLVVLFENEQLKNIWERTIGVRE